MDFSMKAVFSECFPFSLGIRTQTLKMRFVEPATPGRFLSPDIDNGRFIADMESRMEKTGGVENAFPVPRHDALRLIGNILSTDAYGIYLSDMGSRKPQEENITEIYRACIGEIISLIYAPFFVRDNALIDGITGSLINAGDIPVQGKTPENRSASVSFLSTLCPNCGWQMLGEKGTIIMLCGKCNTAWTAASGVFTPVPRLRAFEKTPGDLLLPFWRLSVECKGFVLKSAADYVRLANLPRVISPEMEDRPFFFWVPAFKVNPSAFLMLGRMLTMNQPFAETAEGFGTAACHPATLPASEALQSVPILFAETGSSRSRLLPYVKPENFILRSTDLALVPFVARAGEYVQPEMNVGVMKNALVWGKGM
jgi:hypothetical protein